MEDSVARSRSFFLQRRRMQEMHFLLNIAKLKNNRPHHYTRTEYKYYSHI